MRLVLKFITMILLSVSYVNASDKELFDKILKNAITTIIMEKYQEIKSNNGLVFKIDRVFPTPSGRISIQEKGKCVANWKTTNVDCF